MKRLMSLAAFSAALTCGTAQAQQVTVKIGVMSDMSSLYADIGGPGSTAAAKLAIADFAKANPNIKVELLSADHQNKADVGSSVVNQWFDVEKVDLVVDVPNSGVALAVSEIARDKNKVFIVSGAAASDLTGGKCNANTVHWTYDTWMLANGTGKALVKTGGDTWFFLTADYAFGHALERDTARGGRGERRQGARQGAPSAQHQRLLVVPAAGADLEGQDHRPRQCRRRHHQLDQGGRRVRHRQGRAEVRRPSGVRERRQCARARHRAGPDPDREPGTGTSTTPTAPGPSAGRPSAPRGKFPTMVQAGVYAGVTHYLKAVSALKSAADGKAVVAKMKELPTDDPLFGKGTIRADGRKVHDAYLFEVKKPAEVEVSGRLLSAARHHPGGRSVPSAQGRRLPAGERADTPTVVTGRAARIARRAPVMLASQAPCSKSVFPEFLGGRCIPSRRCSASC